MDQTSKHVLDTQQVEIIGRSFLLSCCIADGVEVAQPIRDKGIDLIIFNDISDQQLFISVPIQLKAASKANFSINKKYAKIPNLLMAYVWHSADPIKARLFLLTYADVELLATKLGWLTTRSWIDNGFYSTQNPSKKLTEMLSSYEYSPGSISRLVLASYAN